MKKVLVALFVFVLMLPTGSSAQEKGLKVIDIISSNQKIKVALVDPSYELSLVLGGNHIVNSAEKTSRILARTQNGILAINGDFFDLKAPHIARGGMADRGILIKSPSPTRRQVCVERGRMGFVSYDSWSMTLASKRLHTVKIDGFNSEYRRAGISAYSAYWGSKTPSGIVNEITLRGFAPGLPFSANGTYIARVVSIKKGGSSVIPKDGIVISGRGYSAIEVKKFKSGDIVFVSSSLVTDAGWPCNGMMIGGRPIIIKGSKAFRDTSAFTQKLEPPGPRTILAAKADGTIILLVAEGRRPKIDGLTLNQLSTLLMKLGVSSAINLDGGGSSVMAKRNGNRINLLTTPSDIIGGNPSEREVSNAIVVVKRRKTIAHKDIFANYLSKVPPPTIIKITPKPVIIVEEKYTANKTKSSLTVISLLLLIVVMFLYLKKSPVK